MADNFLPLFFPLSPPSLFSSLPAPTPPCRVSLSLGGHGVPSTPAPPPSLSGAFLSAAGATLGSLVAFQLSRGALQTRAEEALQARRETLGDRHADTLTSIGSMGLLLKAIGKLEEARPLYEEALHARRATLGDRHPSTLTSIYNLGALLEKQGKIVEAIPLFTEELEGLVSLHGMEFQETRESAEHLAELLRKSNRHEEAKALAAKHEL